jgi:hypothetical protein
MGGVRRRTCSGSFVNAARAAPAVDTQETCPAASRRADRSGRIYRLPGE